MYEHIHAWHLHKHPHAYNTIVFFLEVVTKAPYLSQSCKCLTCLLRCWSYMCMRAGAQRTFTRRKQDMVCLHGGDYKRPAAKSKPCACTAGDVECDYGYVSDSKGGCTALPQVKGRWAWCMAQLESGKLPNQLRLRQ